MKVFEAKNISQLTKCLKLLHAEGFSGPHDVRVKETEKKKIVYELVIDFNDEKYDAFMDKYRQMILS